MVEFEDGDVTYEKDIWNWIGEENISSKNIGDDAHYIAAAKIVKVGSDFQLSIVAGKSVVISKSVHARKCDYVSFLEEEKNFGTLADAIVAGDNFFSAH